MPEISFINFWVFLQFFSEFSCSGRVWTEFVTKFFFALFRFISSVLVKTNAKKRFHNFLNFFTIFSQNFLSRVEYEWNSGLKFCFHFFDLSHSVLAKNNAGKRFFNFLISFSIFSEIFLPWSRMNRIRD